MNQMMRYDAARSALEACVSVDEVKEWSDSAAAYQAYARQTKDKGLQKMAVDIRMRAKRRLGELMAAQKLTNGMSKGGRPKKTGGTTDPSFSPPPTLAEVGIDKRLAREARTAAALSPEAFEAAIETRKAAIDQPDFAPASIEPEPFDANAELLDLAAEAMAIVDADDRLKAALGEVAKAKRETKTVSALYDSLKGEVAAHKRDATRWMKKAKKSALCPACKVAMERDDD